MPAIEAYSFGMIVINGTQYTKDVIIFPDGSVLSPWWRDQGHLLETADIRELIEAGPEVIVCGTGAMGVMRISAELKKHLEACGIELIALKTGKAIEIFNQLSGNRKIGACFHLTC